MRWPANAKAIQQAYQAHGFVIVKQFCDAAAVEQLRQNLQRYITDVVPRVPLMDVFFEDKSTKQLIRMLPRMEKHDAYFLDLISSGPLRHIAEFLCGCPVDPHDAAYFNKLAEIGEATPPHQDGFYFHLEPCEALTLWLALDDVDEENGCVRYVAGSHRHGMRGHGRTGVLGFSQGIVDYGTEHDLANETPACVKAGDLIVHDAMTIHRTDANHSSRSRRALGFVYFARHAKIDQASSDRYQQQLAAELKAEGKI